MAKKTLQEFLQQNGGLQLVLEKTGVYWQTVADWKKNKTMPRGRLVRDAIIKLGIEAWW